MPPRRSSRAPPPKATAENTAKPAAKPASKPSTKTATKAAAKPTSKPAARGRPKTVKRPSSPENSPPPPAKRSRPLSKLPSNGAITEENPKEKALKAAIKKVAPPRARKVATEPVSYFNALPSPPEHHRPAPQLFTWGAGNFGQFGMGPDILAEFDKPRKSPWVEKKITEDTFGEDGGSLEAIAAGGLHTLFIDEKGTIWSCGTNDNAALGRVTSNVPDPDKPGEFLDIDTLTSYPYPLESLVEENFRAVRVAAGDSISAAISDKGELRVWGSFRAAEGALGFSSSNEHQFKPSPILDLKSKPNNPEKFTAVAAGNNHLLVLTTHGNVYAWGTGEQGQLGRKVIERRKIHGTVPEKIVLGSRSRKAVVIGAGGYTSFAVDDKGTVWAWGLNNMGQTGTGIASGTADPEVQRPQKVEKVSASALTEGETVVEIAGGEHHTLFLTSKGNVYACGRSEGGQLGLEDDDEALENNETPGMLAEPALVTFPDDDDPIVHISAGIHNNLAVSKAGALYTWGIGPQGELGAGDETEIRTPKMIVRKEGGAWNAIAASCGGQHTLALLKRKTPAS